MGVSSLLSALHGGPTMDSDGPWSGFIWTAGARTQVNAVARPESQHKVKLIFKLYDG